MSQSLAFHLEISVGNLRIDVFRMVESETTQRVQRIETSQRVEPKRKFIGVSLNPAFLKDGMACIPQVEEIENDTRQTESLV